MKKPLISKPFGASALAALLLLTPLSPVQADKLNQSVYAFGESLTPEQKEKTAQLLQVEDKALEMQVNIQELNALLHDDYPYHQVYSSVYLDPTDQDGVSVEIVTPETITHITSTQYANAAITAGATNMQIRVASVKAVDGSGALAGVYKAFRGTTGELKEENVKVAQKELEVTAKISEDNKAKEGFSDELLNAAVAEIKAQIAKEKEEKGGSLSPDQISVIIQNVVNNYHLQDVLEASDLDQLKELMEKFSSLQLTDEQMANLKELGTKLLDSGQKVMEKVQSSWNSLSPETKSEIGGFFSSLFQTIADFIGNLFH